MYKILIENLIPFFSDYFLYPILFIVLLSTFQSCKSPTAPIQNPVPDTTSNNFTFQTFTLGAPNSGSCYLKDAAIISDSNIWCVGAVYLDSANGAPDPFPYNVVHWDGKKWNLVKAPFYYQGKAFFSPIYSIYAFSDSNIWLEAGIHWDGNQFQTIPLNIDFPSHVNRMWGTSSNDLYIVGNSGLIAHRGIDGYWQKIESGTTLQFSDIYGAADPTTGVQQILAVCFQSNPPANALFRIQGNNATKILNNFNSPDYSMIPNLYGVWFVPNRHYYIAGNGIYEKHSLSDSTWKNGQFDITSYAITSITGNGLNDIYAVGTYGEFLHFNGVRWKSFRNEIAMTNGVYGRVAVKGNLIVVVGENPPHAVITIAKRQ